jgi:uncharacterized protein YbbC (DUF1343 family)
MMANVDLLVYDYVIGSPNPINGLAVEGPLAGERHLQESPFVAYMRIPIRHGMTVGELARMYNAEKNLGADLHKYLLYR